MSYTSSDFGFVSGLSTSGAANSVGYSGNDDRVAAFLNNMFAPEIAVASLTLPHAQIAQAQEARAAITLNVNDIGSNLGR